MLVVLSLAACRTAGRVSPHPDPLPRGENETGIESEGLGSYYGAGFQGQLTANGEHFDKQALTAAHRTLPFGTCVRVQSVASGRFVNVRVNDRGPFVEDRIIDLSEAAARELGMIDAGVGQVKLSRCLP
jgi:rare lipoprotein A